MFDRPKTVVQPRPADWQTRLDIGNGLMMDELAQIAADDATEDAGYPYRVVSRRMHDVLNSCWHEDPVLQTARAHQPGLYEPGRHGPRRHHRRRDDRIAIGAVRDPRGRPGRGRRAVAAAFQ